MSYFGSTEKYLTKNGKPWIPIMGECHYSRLDERRWKKALEMMKNGGIEIVSTYVIWIHHEEVEGNFTFEERKNLRRFLELCKEAGLYVWLRIGPWCHGEVRNGGFPDYLVKLGKDEDDPIELRSNDEQYLKYVKRFFERVGKECSDLFFSSGGPIIGVQIENEYGHVGGFAGDKGEEHMKTLTKMAKESGLIVPYYTATAWGGACTGGLMPVYGGYCEAPWDSRVCELEPNENYVFSFDNEFSDKPYLTAELGGGLQVTHHRRPRIGKKDIGSIALVKLGSGANGLGFYVYHGGTNPEGILSTLQESKATGYSNDYPIYSYDFQAPIGEFGKIRPSYIEIQQIARFIKENEKELAESTTFIPKHQTELPISIRYWEMENKVKGFLFYNNYVRHGIRKALIEKVIEFDFNGINMIFPPVTVDSDSYGVIGFEVVREKDSFRCVWTKHHFSSKELQYINEDLENLQEIKFELIKSDEKELTYRASLAEQIELNRGESAFLKILYEGDEIRVFSSEEMIHDAFYFDGYYEIDLELYDYPENLTLKVLRGRDSSEVYYEPGYRPRPQTDGLRKIFFV